MPYTIEEFAKTIKAKYPQYNNIDDVELVNRVVEKYPQYKDSLSVENPPRGALGSVGATAKTILGAIVKPVVDVGLGLINAPMHPIQTARGVAIGAASMMPGMAPSYVTHGSPGYVDPMAAAKLSQGIAEIAKTPQERRGVTMGQIGATWGVGPELKTARAIASGAIVNKPVEIISKGIEQAGKTALRGEMKIEKGTARAFNENIMKAKKEAMNIISKYNLESIPGGISGIESKSRAEYVGAVQGADKLIDEYAKSVTSKRADLADLIKSVRKDIDDGSVVNIGNETKAQEILTKMYEQAAVRGFSGKIPYNQLRDYKRRLNVQNDLFKKSPMGMAEEPVEKNVREHLFMKIVDKIGEDIPAAKALNQKARELKYVNKIAQTAEQRIFNQNKGLLGALPEIGMGSAGLAGAVTHPEQMLPIVLGTAGLMAARRLGGAGRGSSLLISVGKAGQKAAGVPISEMVKKKVRR